MVVCYIIFLRRANKDEVKAGETNAWAHVRARVQTNYIFYLAALTHSGHVASHPQQLSLRHVVVVGVTPERRSEIQEISFSGGSGQTIGHHIDSL